MKARLLLCLISLIASLLLACASEPTPRQEELPTLTEHQAISSVLVYGVPTFKLDDLAGSPVGQWAAAYKDNNRWQVRGSIVIRYGGKDYYFVTTWQCYVDNQGLERIEFLKYEGELPPAPQSPKITTTTRTIHIHR